MGTQETVGQGFVFAEQSQEQVLGLNIRRAELAGFVPREKDDAPCFFRITLEHIAPVLFRRTAGQRFDLSPRTAVPRSRYGRPGFSDYRRPAFVLPLLPITKGTNTHYRNSSFE